VISGAVAGHAARATENVLSGQEVTEGLGNPTDIPRDAALSAALAGVGRSVDIALTRARYPGYYTRYVSEGELQAIEETGLLRGGRPKETYFTTNRFGRLARLHLDWLCPIVLNIVWPLRL
jgi:hypothetical protein